MKKIIPVIAAVLAFSSQASAGSEVDMTIERRLARFAPARIEADGLAEGSETAKIVNELVEAARYMDHIFLRQVYSRNPQILASLKEDPNSPPGMLDYFLLNLGPFDRIDHNRPFVPGVGEKPAGANFYPEDMSREEFEAWIAAHPGEREAFESSFTVIRRREGGLWAAPYSEEYAEFLAPAARHLRRAARMVKNPSLSRYLESRADAFISNDYFQSDVDWVRLEDHAIEVVIGPYEVYEDALMGYKAAFEAFVTIVDKAESERLARAVGFLDQMEQNLPIPDEHKGRGRSLSSPIVVAQLVYSAGDTKAGVQTLAFNLPNDERVRAQEGSKKVMLKNVQRAKYEKILVPLAARVMSPENASAVDFDAFFAHTLLHEMSHGIGPGEIEKGGEKTTVNRELKDLYTVIEECKADTLGVYNAIFLTREGLYPEDFLDSVWPTYLAGLFRSMRFGIGGAHGGGNAIQFNYLRRKRAIVRDRRSGLFALNEKRIEEAVRELAREVLMIQAEGDYGAAKRFVRRYRRMPKELESALARLGDLPVDIRPVYAWE